VRTSEGVGTVKGGEVGGWMGGDEVCEEGRGRAVEGAADDLLYLPCMQVDAGTEARHRGGGLLPLV